MWNKEIEMMNREAMRELQGKRLREAVWHMYKNVAPYRAKMDAAGIAPGDINTIDDIKKLPFTYKKDLRDNYPFGMVASDMDDVVRIHASSGTTGKQTVVCYTREDIGIWSEVMARTFSAGGVTKKDIGHIAYGYGLFTGGLGAHYGSELIGAATLPISAGNTSRQVQLLADFGCTFICCTPSYAIYLAEAIKESGYDLNNDIKLKSGFFGAEPWTENMRREIEENLGIKAYDIYGLSEIIGPGVSFECDHADGLHVNEDHFIPEIIDPETGMNMPDGQVGELVFTCVTKTAMPLIRYRTRDISRLDSRPCPCGRGLVRMMKPSGRTDDMLIIRGVNVFPSQVESVLLELEEITPHYQIIVDRKDMLDTMEVQVEVKEEAFSDEIRMLEKLERKVSSAIESAIGVGVTVRLVEPKSIGRSEGKAKRVIDKRVLI